MFVFAFFRSSQTDAARAAIRVSGSRNAGTSGTGVPLSARFESPPATHPGETTTVYAVLYVGADEYGPVEPGDAQMLGASVVSTLTS